MISYRGEEQAVQFFGSDVPQADEAMIQGSINTLEFDLTAGIRRSIALSPRALPSLKATESWRNWPWPIW